MDPIHGLGYDRKLRDEFDRMTEDEFYERLGIDFRIQSRFCQFVEKLARASQQLKWIGTTLITYLRPKFSAHL